MPEPFISGRYEVLRQLGIGGMGLVWLAFDHRLQTEVAIKQLRPELAANAAEKGLLIKEARILAKLGHPSIVRLFDLAETEYGLLMILEYVCGPNLQQVLQVKQRLSESETLYVMKQVCAGLSLAHSEGIIHRDLKPSNLLVSLQGEDRKSHEAGIVCGDIQGATIKITDFGISKLLSASRRQQQVRDETTQRMPVAPDSALTLPFAGTPAYMAPEQIRGEAPTPMTDVYALGVITYLLLSGQVPFTEANPAYQHLLVPAPRLEGCSEYVADAVARALEKKPQDRFQSAGAFFEALSGGPRTMLEVRAPVRPPAPRRLPPVQPYPSGPRIRNVTLWSVGAGLAIVLAIAGVIKVVSSAMETSEEELEPRPMGHRVAVLGDPIRLPYEMDSPPTITKLPTVQTDDADGLQGTWPPKAAGPQRPKVAWQAFVDTNYEVHPQVVGTNPQGTTFLALRGSETVWAIREGRLQWGYHWIGPRDLVNDFSYSEASFRPDGRVWVTSCDVFEDRQCPALVFNQRGEGGYMPRVRPPAPFVPVAEGLRTYKWEFLNARQSVWRDRGKDRYRCEFRGAVPYLDSVGPTGKTEWSVPLDKRCDLLAISDGQPGLLLGTDSNTIYSINAVGTVDWKYQAAKGIDSVRRLPNGDFVVIAGRAITYLRNGLVTRSLVFDRYDKSLVSGIVVDRDSSIYFLVRESSNLVIYAVDSGGNYKWTLLLPGPSDPSYNSLSLDSQGNLIVIAKYRFICVSQDSAK